MEIVAVVQSLDSAFESVAGSVEMTAVASESPTELVAAAGDYQSAATGLTGKAAVSVPVRAFVSVLPSGLVAYAEILEGYGSEIVFGKVPFGTAVHIHIPALGHPGGTFGIKHHIYGNFPDVGSHRKKAPFKKEDAQGKKPFHDLTH